MRDPQTHMAMLRDKAVARLQHRNEFLPAFGRQRMARTPVAPQMPMRRVQSLVDGSGNPVFVVGHSIVGGTNVIGGG